MRCSEFNDYNYMNIYILQFKHTKVYLYNVYVYIYRKPTMYASHM